MSPKEKAKRIYWCLSREVGITKAARIAGTHPTVINKWIALCETEGVAGFMPRNGNRVYDVKSKIQAVLDYLSGEESYLDICPKYKIRNSCQIENYVKVYNAYGDFNSIKCSGGGSYIKQGRDTT